MASFTCPPGAICPPSAGEPIGANKTKIYYSTATTVTQGSDGKVNGAERVLYIDKNGSYQPAAISKDGGKTYNFSDPKYPLMAGVAGADLQKDLNNPASGIHKNVDAGIAKYLPKTGIPPTQQKAVVASTANQAPGGAAGGSTIAANPQLAADTKKGAAGSFRYPANLAQMHQDIIKFNLVEYIPGGIPDASRAGRPPSGKILGTVVLPVPNLISDTNTAEWGADSMNAFQAAGAAAAFQTITGGVAAGLESAQASLTAIGKDSEGVKTALGSFFAAAAVQGEGAKLLSRASGQIVNPNLELLFNGPQLRPFNFTFKLAARSEGEGKTILEILRFFKRGMSPIRSESNLFLKSPNTFTIEYQHMGKTNPNIGKIKECALQSVTTSYTPEGQYATFSDGVMVSYSLQLTFSELEPIFTKDYEDSPDGIGY
jgi:hypothetical protein